MAHRLRSLFAAPFVALANPAFAAPSAASLSASLPNLAFVCLGAFVATLLIAALWVFTHHMLQPTVSPEEIAALREARLRAYTESDALQETLDREQNMAGL